MGKSLYGVFCCLGIVKSRIFATSLAKGMPCESATVPAAVSPRKACQTSHCTEHPYGKATGSGESEDLPNQLVQLQAFGNKGDAKRGN